MYQKALEIQMSHPHRRVDVSLYYGNIGLALSNLGRHREAHESFTQCLQFAFITSILWSHFLASMFITRMSP